MISLHIQGLFHSELSQSNHINLNKKCRPSLIFTDRLQEPSTENYVGTDSCLSDRFKMVYRGSGGERDDEESAVGAKSRMGHFSNMVSKDEITGRYDQDRVGLLVHVIGVGTDFLETLSILDSFVICRS